MNRTLQGVPAPNPSPQNQFLTYAPLNLNPKKLRLIGVPNIFLKSINVNLI